MVIILSQMGLGAKVLMVHSLVTEMVNTSWLTQEQKLLHICMLTVLLV